MAEELFGMTVEDRGDNQFRIGKAEYFKFLDNEGITKDVRQKIKETEEKLFAGAAEFLGKKVVENKKAASLKILDDGAQIKLTYGDKNEYTVPKTGEKGVKYGGLSIKVTKNVPKILVGEDGIVKKYDELIKKTLG